VAAKKAKTYEAALAIWTPFILAANSPKFGAPKGEE